SEGGSREGGFVPQLVTRHLSLVTGFAPPPLCNRQRILPRFPSKDQQRRITMPRSKPSKSTGSKSRGGTTGNRRRGGTSRPKAKGGAQRGGGTRRGSGTKASS